jgi:hypothetical protein
LGLSFLTRADRDSSFCNDPKDLEGSTEIFSSKQPFNYTIVIKHRLSKYTSMKHSLLLLQLSALALNSLDTLSDVRIKAVLLLF